VTNTKNIKMKRIPRNIEKEHNGPDGHKIPNFFPTIAKNLGKKVSGQSLRFEGPTGKLVYGGAGTDVVGDGAFKMGTRVKTVGGDFNIGPEGNVMDDDLYVIEDND
jgi:hypothetical protein